VKLTKTEELHDLLGLGRDSDGTPDTDNKSNLGLGRDVETTLGLGIAAVGNGGLIGSLVLSSVLLSGSNGILLVLTLLLPGIVGSLLGLFGNLGLVACFLRTDSGTLLAIFLSSFSTSHCANAYGSGTKTSIVVLRKPSHCGVATE